MTDGISTRGSKILVGAIALMIATGATFAGTLIPLSPGAGGNNIQPVPPVSGGGGGNNIDAAATWNNLGTDWNTAANWTGTVPTGANGVGQFTTVESVQPNLSASISIAGIYFSGTGSSGYDVTSSAGAVFTLNGTGATGAGGTSNSTAAAIRSEITSGTNTVDAPMILGAAAASTQVFFQSSGGTLIVNGAISNTNAITLDLKGTGIIQLNANNSSLSAAVRIADAGTTVQVGNDGALGTGSFTFASSGTIEASGGARTLANNVFFATGTPTIGGSNGITFNGNFTNSGAANRTITVNNSANTTLNGNLYMAGDDVTGRIVTINGTGNITINGVVANNNAGNTTASSLVKSGTNTLTLTNANTYTGTTTVSQGTLLVNNSTGSGTGTGAVSVTGSIGTSTIGGTGSVSGAVTIGNSIGTADSFISPGTSVGTFTTTSTLSIASDGVYKFELNSNTSTADKIVAAGVSLATTSTISLADLGSTVLTLGTSFTIIDNTSGSAITGFFSNLTDGQQVAIGVNIFEADYEGGNGNDLTLTVVVPEPTTVAMMVLGGSLLVGMQRFRRKLR